MSSLKFSMFGQFRVWRGEDPIENGEWDRQKTRSLLKLLLTRPGRTFSKDEIFEALWPNLGPEAAGRSLRVTVSKLRKVLEPDLGRGPDSRYILSQRPGYLFDQQADCRVDTWEFEARLKEAEAARGVGEVEEAIRGYEVALCLAEDEFLAEDPYEEWAMEARQEHQERRLSAFSNLSECLSLKGRYTEAIEACGQALLLDRYNEELHRRLMLYHYCAGEQALALQAYRSYARMLEEELGVHPSPELTRLHGHIEAREVPRVDEGRRQYPRPRRPLKLPYSLSRTHFAGRDEEYAWLVEKLREAREGSGGSLAVEGEAGVGKTRLVEEFLGHARSRGVRVLSGRCYERELGAPLEPVLEALEPLIDTSSALAPEDSGRPDYLINPEKIADERSRVYRMLAGELIRESRNGGEPLVLFIDDLQWADSATLDFLSYLARRIVDERIMLVFTYRREDALFLSGWLRRLAERRAAATLNLYRLSQEDLAQILKKMSSRGFEDLASLADFLYRESEGNPFYAVEYLRWLIESGAVEIDSRRRICALKSEELREGALPHGVRALIRTRLDSLDEESQSLMEIAAVIGRGFDLDLLSKAASRAESEVFANLKPAMSSGLVVETPQETYYFSHDKLRGAIYDDVDSPRRRKLHIRVARALEITEGEPADLAHHYLRAKAWAPALENLKLAAEKAEGHSAWNTALEYYARALEIVDRLPDSEDERYGLLVSKERLLEHVDRHEERAETVKGMLELANRSGDPARVGEVHVRRIGVLMALSGPEDAIRAGEKAVAIYEKLGDRAGEARVHRELGYALSAHGDYAAALQANFRELRIQRELENLRGEAGASGNLAQVYRRMEDQENTLRWAGKALRIYGELGNELGEGFALHTLAAVYLKRGDLRSALSLILESVDKRVGPGARILDVAEYNTCGMLYLRLGEAHEALEQFRLAVRLSRKTGYLRDEGYSLVNTGIALERTGDAAGAEEAYRQAVEVLETAYRESDLQRELAGKAEALILLGNVLHRSLGRLDEARESYEEAARIYRKLGETQRLRKLLMNLAGLCWQAKDYEKSARHYEEALELSRKYDETTQEAAALASLSVVYRDLDRTREAIRCGKEAIDLLRDLEDSQAEAYVLTSLADSYEALEYYPTALSHLKRSLRLRRKVGDLEGEIVALRDLARLYKQTGDAKRAQTALAKAADREGFEREPEYAAIAERSK